MANGQRGVARGAVIQGRFIGGRFRPPGVTSPSPIQPRMAGAQPIQPRMSPPNAAQNRAANPHINQHSAHLQRIAQAKMAQPRVVPHQAVQLRSAAPQNQVVQRHGNGEAFQLPANLSNFGGGGQPLPGAVQRKMESFFGTSFADVRVHVGPQASSIGALAFTQGSNLYFAQGQYNPHTPQGQQILGHELTHVVQQRAGRVNNPFGSGVAVVQDRAMEAEADRMGMRAASHKSPVQAKMRRAGQASVAQRAVSPSSALFPGVVQPAGCWDSIVGCWRSIFNRPEVYEVGDSNDNHSSGSEDSSSKSEGLIDNHSSGSHVVTIRPPSRMVFEGMSVKDLNYPTALHCGFISSCALVIFCGVNSFDCHHAKGGIYNGKHGMRGAPTHIYYVYMTHLNDTDESVANYRKNANLFRKLSGGNAPLTFLGQKGYDSNIMVDVLSADEIVSSTSIGQFKL
ncbi:MAG: hypothetical protein QOD28_3092 [Acidobacteriota bacterium]|nr:hypothetical protein [Acidobacteriota bacterium]